jgi:hypothetical protein
MKTVVIGIGGGAGMDAIIRAIEALYLVTHEANPSAERHPGADTTSETCNAGA